MNLAMLSLNDLNMLRGQTEKEVDNLAQSVQALEVAASRFAASKDALTKMKKSFEGASIFLLLSLESIFFSLLHIRDFLPLLTFARRW